MGNRGRWVWKPENSLSWQYEFAIRGVRYRGNTGCGSKREAEQFAREEREQQLVRVARERQERGTAPGKPKDMTFLRAVERYFDEVASHNSREQAVKSDKLAFFRLIEWVGEETMLSEINEDVVARVVAKRRAEFRRGDPKRGRLSGAQVNRTTVELMRRVMNRARDTWGVPTKPIKWGKLKLKEAGPRRRELSLAEEDRLIPHFREGYGLAFRLAAESGLRLGNLTGLRWQEVDFENGFLRIVQKGQRDHAVPVSDAMLNALAAERGRHPIFVFTFVAEQSFTNPRNGSRYVAGQRYPMTYAGFSAWFRRLRWRVGIPDLRPHDLRRTAACRLLRNTGNLKATSELLGHSDIATTARSYAHVLQEDMRHLLNQSVARTGERRRALRMGKSPKKSPNSGGRTS